jgi:hypothetical protein
MRTSARRAVKACGAVLAWIAGSPTSVKGWRAARKRGAVFRGCRGACLRTFCYSAWDRSGCDDA